MASAVEAARATLRDAAARHPRRASAPFAEVARQTAHPRVAAGDRVAGAAARRAHRRAGHALRTERRKGGIAAPKAALAAVRGAAIGRGRGRTGRARRERRVRTGAECLAAKLALVENELLAGPEVRARQADACGRDLFRALVRAAKRRRRFGAGDK